MKEIRLQNGKICRVDDFDFERLSAFKWYDLQGYVARKPTEKLDGKRPWIRMHREILGLEVGDGKIVDHIDCDRLNNQRSNLRLATFEQNCANRTLNRNNKSGYKGVSFHKPGNRWVAQISIKSKVRSLGLYDDPKEAYEVYCLAADMLRGEYANHG